MKDNREFRTVVKGIKRSEKDVDKVLNAARLRRTESGRMSGDNLEKILDFTRDILFGAAVIIVVLAYFYVLSH